MTSVAPRPSANNSPHLATNSMTSSPRSSKNSISTTDLKLDGVSANQAKRDSIPTVNQPEESKPSSNIPTANAPLAPPPKPNQNADGQQENFSKEPNPFESAFGGGPSDQPPPPPKPQLPGVTSLTSPASLLPGNTPAWPGSLRSGPLSPAMLQGPTGSNDYFNSDHHFGGSFPTPNESSLRTGLTPGGGGSMFPQPSPNSQAIFNQLQSGGATPGTLDFHRTAMTARAQQHQGNGFGMNQNSVTSQPAQNPNIQPDLDAKSYSQAANQSQQQQENQDPFSSHQTNDAANGLFMLAQAGGQRNGQQNFAMPAQPQSNYQQQDQSMKHGGKNSIGSNSTENHAEFSDGSAEAKPATRNRGKKNASTGKAPANGKRKPEDTPLKAVNKKHRGNSGQAMPSEEPEDEDDQMDDEELGADGKKMTDEEKRKNFLERNRVAALKCRQRKKQWLANLQQKVEIFSTENDALAATVTQLREEIVGLKTLLLAHKDCPVSQAQGISGSAMQQIAGDTHGYANPYGLAMGPGGPPMQQAQMMQAGMQRR